MKHKLIIVGLVLGIFVSFANASEVEFNYEGRVLVDGLAFTGSGYFKFAVVIEDGALTLWSNDGTSTTGDEPTGSVLINVDSGVFNVIVGDASQTNMDSISPAVFNIETDYYLRVWFSDTGEEGTFEHLAPDRKITDARIIGLRSIDSIDIYVDPIDGNDNYVGIFPAAPKKTIQAAWDALPALISKNATIHLEDGVYREEVLLTGKTLIGNAVITIIGNESSPVNVRVTGADEGAETSSVRERGFNILNQEDLNIIGISFDHYTSNSVYIERSAVNMEDCIITENDMNGIVITQQSRSVIENVEIYNIPSGAFGIYLMNLSYLELRYCYIHDTENAINALDSSKVSIFCSTFSNVYNALFIGFNAVATFAGQEPYTQVNDSNCGVYAHTNAVVGYSEDFVVYSNVTTPRKFYSDSVQYH